jgi:hypothetical protein
MQGLDCMVDYQELQISVSERFPWYGRMMMGIVVQQKNAL